MKKTAFDASFGPCSNIEEFASRLIDGSRSVQRLDGSCSAAVTEGASRRESRREARQQLNDSPPDRRFQGERDRDRVLYTSALRRLVGITQVVAPTERIVLHNRLTHTHEVAQIGRRVTQKLSREGGEALQSLVGGLDEEVVEAAALAHDLGHPPFGHVAEEELDALIKPKYISGFNGNAQSFRIVSKLAVRRDNLVGLNLTSATLNAILKYPWSRLEAGAEHRKWGYYHTERREFEWARERARPGQDKRSAEAEIMDWADDVAYAVHDAEDFYRAGLIPLDRLVKDRDELERFLEIGIARMKKYGPLFHDEQDLKTSFTDLIATLLITEPYSGSRQQRADLRRMTSQLIAGYIEAFKFQEVSGKTWRAEIEPRAKMEVAMLKRLTWHYVIHHPSLATQQYGYRRVIRNLFEVYCDASTPDRGDARIFSPGYLEHLEAAKTDEERTRVVADLIASMTEQQAIDVHSRLTGISVASVLNPLGP